MEILYQRELDKNYMILPSGDSDEKESFEKRMVLDNHINGLLPVDSRIINGDTFYYYNIHSLQSLQVIFEHKLFDKETLIHLFSGMTKVFKELGRYLLSPESLFLKPECVYMDIESGEVFLCFYPWKKAGRETFEELAEFLIDRVNHGEDDAKELAYAYYEKVCEGEYNPESIIEQMTEVEIERTELSFSVPVLSAYQETQDREEFYFVEPGETEEENAKFPLVRMVVCIGMILLAAGFYLFLLKNPGILSVIGLSQEDYIVIGAVTAVIAAAGMMAVVRCLEKKKEIVEQVDNGQAWECKSDNLEEEIEDREEYFGETTILSVKKPRNIPQLRGMDGDEERKFIIDENPFIIGKLSGKANGILTDSRVSRIHAAIREDSGNYYISDLNSTNGTFINERRLNGTETVQLHHMDRVCMASVEMVFLCQ